MGVFFMAHMQHELAEEEQEQGFSRGILATEEWFQFTPGAIWKWLLSPFSITAALQLLEATLIEHIKNKRHKVPINMRDLVLLPKVKIITPFHKSKLRTNGPYVFWVRRILWNILPRCGTYSNKKKLFGKIAMSG